MSSQSNGTSPHAPCRVAAVWARDGLEGRGGRSRPQPIRDVILAYLSEPRQAKQVAGCIGRSIPTATGHLGAMCRLGLVVRTGYGRYERADLVADGSLPDVIVRPHPVRDAALACLKGPVHCDTVATLTGRTPLHALQVLQQLVRHGLAVHLGQGMFSPRHGDARADSEACGTVRAVGGDAGLGNRKEVPCSHSPSPAAIPATP